MESYTVADMMITIATVMNQSYVKPANYGIRYFTKTFSVIYSRKRFKVPDHIPKLNKPSTEFDLK